MSLKSGNAESQSLLWKIPLRSPRLKFLLSTFACMHALWRRCLGIAPSKSLNSGQPSY